VRKDLITAQPDRPQAKAATVAEGNNGPRVISRPSGPRDRAEGRRMAVTVVRARRKSGMDNANISVVVERQCRFWMQRKSDS
jgi:hypothetical protein